MMVFFGGKSQDRHHYAVWFPLSTPAATKLLDTTASTLNGNPTTTALSFKLHSATLDRSGRFVTLVPTVGDLRAPRYASPLYVWDTTTDIFTALTTGGKDGGANVHPYGHLASGYGYNVNHDCCTSTKWDAAQWQVRSLTNPLIHSDLITPVIHPQQFFLSDHTTWGNALPTVLVPIISATYRYGTNRAAWRTWDDEIIAIETNTPAGAATTVWRFAQHRSNVGSDADPSTLSFWYTPRPNVSRDGRFVIFTSNWEKTLGKDSRDGMFRQDVFLVQLR